MKKKKTVFADVLQTVTKYFLILVVVVMLGIFCSGIRIVKSGNVALVLRFGKLVGQTYEEQVREPGLLLAFPYIIDEVVMVPTGSVVEQSVTTYYTAQGEAKTREGAYVVTGNQNVAVLSASVKYSITNPVEYALHVKDIQSVINACVSNAMLSEAAGCDVDTLLTSGKDAFASNALRRASQKLEQAGVGVTLSTLELTQVGMPPELREVYDKVNSAAVEAQTTIEGAYQYRERLLPYAESTATTTIADANSAKSAAVAEANTTLTEFWGVLEEFQTNPEVVKTRIYAAKLNEILGKIGKVRVVQDGETKIILTP